MVDLPEMHSDASEVQKIQLEIDEKSFPELIHNQIGKLQELDAGVKKALEAAEKAEQRAQAAREKSAGWSLFKDNKKVAIEELQAAGVDLAEAVQSGTQAQKLSFELQRQLADITKYLFGLGVSNIAANRFVVRELQKRLQGASEEELSELARQELMSVIRQLQEQEDLLRKQEKMGGRLRDHDIKISYLVNQIDGLNLSVKNRDVQYLALVDTVNSIALVSTQQREDILTLQEESFEQQKELETLNAVLGKALSDTEEANVKVLAQTQELGLWLKNQDAQQRVHTSSIDSLEQFSESHEQDILALQRQVLTQQAELEKLASSLAGAENVSARLRSTVNLRTSLLIIWAIAVPAIFHFLR